MAQAANKVISVTGYGTCTRWPDGEDINYILVEKWFNIYELAILIIIIGTVYSVEAHK